MSGNSNHRLSNRVIVVLRKAYGRNKATTQRSGLEELILGVVQSGTTEAKAVAALNALTRHFVDWNEVRTGQPHEIAAVMGNVPESVPKAQAIRAVLSRLCERTNDLSLDYLQEKGPREALRLIAHIDGFPESALARAALNGLGEDVFPLTPKVVTVCRRLGILKDGADHDAMRRAVARAVSKQSMFELHWLTSRHAEAVCADNDPRCPECVLAKDCPTGRKAARAAARRRRAHAPPRRVAVRKAVKKKSSRRRAAVRKAVKKKSAPRRAAGRERKRRKR